MAGPKQIPGIATAYSSPKQASMRRALFRGTISLVSAATCLCWRIAVSAASTNSFVNFETPPVHPVALSPDGSRLAVCNLPDARLEVFDVSSGAPVWVGNAATGLDPVTARFRTTNEVCVVNLISDSVSVIDLSRMRIVATTDTLDAPADVVFAGTPERIDRGDDPDRKSTRLNSSHTVISYAVFCLKKKKEI